MDFENVRSESLRPSCLVVAQRADKRLQMSVEMPFQAPIIHPRPCAVATRIALLAFLLAGFASVGFGVATVDDLVGRGYLIDPPHGCRRGWEAGGDVEPVVDLALRG